MNFQDVGDSGISLWRRVRERWVLTLVCIPLALALVLSSLFDGLYTFWFPTISGVWSRPERVTLFTIGLMFVVFLVAAIMEGKDSDRRQAGTIIGLGVPLGIIAFIYLATPDEPRGLNFVRGVFVTAAILLPALLFALFVATFRESLLKAYLANLRKLGLLARRKLDGEGVVARYVPARAEYLFEPEADRQVRVRRHLDHFASLYGKLPSKTVQKVIEATDSNRSVSEPVSIDSISVDGGEFSIRAILPVIIATVLFTVGWCAVFPVLMQVLPGSSATTELHLLWFEAERISPVGYAFLGAYFFSLQMIVRRYRRRDLGPNAFIAASMRMILAVIAAWVLVVAYPLLPAAVPTDDPKAAAAASREASRGLMVAAFVIGVFPYVLWQILAKVARLLPALSRGTPLSEVDGLTIWHESRLEEEDVENVENLADADIAELMLQTKIPADRIVEWVDQAILLATIKEQRADADRSMRAELARYGIRTASGLISLCEARLKKGQTAETSFLEFLPVDGTLANRLLAVAEAMKNHPNLARVQRWKGLGDKFLLDADVLVPKAAGGGGSP